MEKIINFIIQMNWGIIYGFGFPIFIIEHIRKKLNIDAKKVYLTIIKILGWLILIFSVIVIIFGDSIYFLFNNEKQNSNMDYAKSGIKIFEFGLLLIITSKVFKE